MKYVGKSVSALLCLCTLVWAHAACPLAGGHGGGGSGYGGDGMWKKRMRTRGHHGGSVQSISISKLVSAMKKGAVTLIDARSASDYAEEHIVSAVRSLGKGGAAQKERLIVIYGADKKCPAAESLAKQLTKRKYKHVSIFKGGLKEWQRRGGPTIAGKAAGEFVQAR